MHHAAGLSTENIAKLEISLAIGVFSNTGPMAFWMLFDLISRPALLEEVRREVRENAVHVEGNVCTMPWSTCMLDEAYSVHETGWKAGWLYSASNRL
jgi:Zn finger protein HypA/HybF involved in hydrogenase expression